MDSVAVGGGEWADVTMCGAGTSRRRWLSQASNFVRLGEWLRIPFTVVTVVAKKPWKE